MVHNGAFRVNTHHQQDRCAYNTVSYALCWLEHSATPRTGVVVQASFARYTCSTRCDLPRSPPTPIAAIELPEMHSQARFKQLVVRLGFETDVPAGGARRAPKSVPCSAAVLPRSWVVTEALSGPATLGEAVVEALFYRINRLLDALRAPRLRTSVAAYGD